MSQSTTLVLLPATSYANPGNGAGYTVAGATLPAAAYYLNNRDLQTVNLKLTGCSASVLIQATLASSPSETDWFTVYQLDADASALPNTAAKLASDANTYANLTGNFMYIRAKLVNFRAGTANYIKLSY